jgi:L-amino acid N-acyltransferase YncA
MLVRLSSDTDIDAITDIYAHWVRNSSATFETEPPDRDEMARRRLDTLAFRLPYLVAEVDGVMAGYAYAKMYRPRAAYRFTVEDSIYVDPEFRRMGIGRALLGEVIEACEKTEYRQMIAVIGGSDNEASIGLHRAMGFEHAGRLRAVGYKFGRWHDSVIMQRNLGAGATARP